MASLSEIKALVMELTVSERATLASRLLDSLPRGFYDDTDADKDSYPSLKFEELKRSEGL